MIRLQLIGNALLLLLGYYWLGVGESTIPRLLWSALLALILLAGLVWLHGSALASARSALRNLAPLVFLAVLSIAVYLLLARWQDYSSEPAFRLASYLTLKLRKPVKPATMLTAFNVVLWVVRWAVMPLILLPVFAGVAERGWRGFRPVRWRQSPYWPATPLLLLCALWAPLKLIGWVPAVGGFNVQMLSLAIRLLAAYLLFVAGVLAIAFITSGGKPSRSQPSTAGSP